MAENYKHLYEQTIKMLTMYQDELIPGFRAKIEELEKNQIKVRCKDCKNSEREYGALFCGLINRGLVNVVAPSDYCPYGERKDNV